MSLSGPADKPSGNLVSQTATFDFGKRFAIRDRGTGQFVSGKVKFLSTSCSWSNDPKRARLFKSEKAARMCTGYRAHASSCDIIEVTVVGHAH